jgi:hypothetical protein
LSVIQIMILTETDLINNYQLLPHPEGGYYKETYRAGEVIQKDSLPLRYQGDRLFSTAIYSVPVIFPTFTVLKVMNPCISTLGLRSIYMFCNLWAVVKW